MVVVISVTTRYGRLSICLVVCVRNNHYLCRVILCHVEYDCVVRCVVFEHGVVTDCEILRIVGVRRDVEDKRVFVYVYIANLTRCTLINRICEDFVLREVVFVNLTRRCVVLRRVNGYNLTVGVLLKCDELVFNVAVFRQRCEYLLCVLAACTVYTNLVRAVRTTVSPSFVNRRSSRLSLTPPCIAAFTRYA